MRERRVWGQSRLRAERGVQPMAEMDWLRGDAPGEGRERTWEWSRHAKRMASRQL